MVVGPLPIMLDYHREQVCEVSTFNPLPLVVLEISNCKQKLNQSLMLMTTPSELHYWYWYWYCSTYCSDFASTGTDTELLLQNFASTGTGTALLS
jgi:hypothetical protein